MLRLADSLAVSSVSSVEFGRLLYLRLDGQSLIAVDMPHTLLQDSELTLIVEYAGRVESENLDIDTVRPRRDAGIGRDISVEVPVEQPFVLVSAESRGRLRSASLA
jgi:hypothetical protein